MTIARKPVRRAVDTIPPGTLFGRYQLIRRLAVGGVVALAGTIAIHLGRGYPWGLSAIVGLACGVLAGTVLQTADRLRALFRDR